MFALYKLFPDVCHTLYYERDRSIKFLHRKNCLLSQKLVFSTTSEVLKNWSYNMHNDCQKTLCSLKYCCLRSAILGNTRQNRPIFLIGLIAVLLKKRLYRPLSSLKIDLKTCTKNTKTLWTPVKCSLRIVIVDDMRKGHPKVFFTGKKAFLKQVVFSTTS